MNKVGRNDPCPCGSGKKYKKCCLTDNDNNFGIWQKNADIILANQEKKDEIKKLFFGLLNYMRHVPWNDGNSWYGACHATSSIMYVLFNEIGLTPTLYMGEVEYESIPPFDHSWVEVNGEIYDAAIYYSLINEINESHPIMKSININTCKHINASYGISHLGLDEVALRINKKGIVDYMDQFPHLSNGLWNIVQEIGGIIDLDINISLLRDKYRNLKWEVRTN